MEKNLDIKQKNADRLISLVLLFFCVFLYFEIQEYSLYGAVFPNAVTILLAIFSVIYFFKSWITLLSRKVESQEELYEMIEDYPSFSIVFPLTVLYIFFLLTYLGFFASSFLFTATVVLSVKIIRGEHNWRILLIYFVVSGVFAYAVYYMFRYLLRIRLPSGIFF